MDIYYDINRIKTNNILTKSVKYNIYLIFLVFERVEEREFRVAHILHSVPLYRSRWLAMLILKLI